MTLAEDRHAADHARLHAVIWIQAALLTSLCLLGVLKVVLFSRSGEVALSLDFERRTIELRVRSGRDLGPRS